MMKRFIYRTLIFIAIIAAADFCFGQLNVYFASHAKGGDSKRIYDIFNNTKEDVLIMGSSRGMYNYSPTIISSYLHLKCHNAGLEGMGIICNYGLFKMIMERHYPKYIIYDIFYKTDLAQYKDNCLYLSPLRPYYYRNDIREIFDHVDRTQKYKMMSNFYKYNSIFLQTIQDAIYPTLSAGLNGFRPIEPGAFHRLRGEEADIQYRYDPQKLYYLKKLIMESKGKTKLIFVISPFFDKKNKIMSNSLRAMCNKLNIPLLDYSAYASFKGNKKWFADNLHLNRKGADVFSKILVKDLK